MKKSTIIATSMVMLLCAFQTKAFATTFQVNETPTKDEILAEYVSSGVKTTNTTEFDNTPVISGNYYEGSLSETTLNDALTLTNFIRYITGLDPVTLNESYNILAQKSSLVSAVNGTISHYPSQPTGMSNDLFEDGYTGSSKSNLSAGRSSILDSIIHGYMADDSSVSNLTAVGHRRWILYPNLGETGFGMVYNTNSTYRYYSAMYVIDKSNTNTHETSTIWPTTNMPVSFFKSSYPWSISTGKTLSNNITVELTKVGEETIIFTSADTDTNGKYLTINNSGYGQTGCIIFRPSNMTYSAGDVFNVVVKENSSVILEYDVTFFDLNEAYEQKTEIKNEDGSTTVIETDGTEYVIYPNGLKIIKNNNTYTVSNVTEPTEIILRTDYDITSNHVAKNISTGEILSFSIKTDDGLKVTVNSDVVFEIIENKTYFSDVYDSSWHKDAVAFVASRQLFSGTSDNVFSPDETMSKAMIWTVLYRYSGETGTTTGINWYLDPQNWIISNDLSNDVENPLEAMTREELASLLYNLEGSPTVNGDYTSSFSDSSSISLDAKTAMNWAVSVGLYQGNHLNCLTPTDTANRAEVATIFMRYLTN
ncbi:MAG: S-layer homology domain-containing protein [Clostridia bacterium]